MINMIIRWLLLALSLLLVGWIVPGVTISGFSTALLTAVVFGFINVFIRPIIMLLTLPINLLTLGLLTFVINALLFMLVAFLVPGFIVVNFFSAFFGALLLSIFSIIINWAAGEMQPA